MNHAGPSRAPAAIFALLLATIAASSVAEAARLPAAAPAGGAADSGRAPSAQGPPAGAAPSRTAAASAPAAEVAVARFSPEGTVKGPQQATARFSAAMVPFGDLTDREPPFDVACARKGTSRWIDSVTWSYDFEEPLASGMRCTFTLRNGVRAVDGRAVTGRRTFEFTTGGPSIVESRPWPGDESIDEQQVFLLSLDGEVDTASIRSNVRFTIEGLPERVEADVVEGAELEQILAGLSRWQRPEPPLVALRARRTFPNGRKIRLEWGKGVRSVSGEATTSAQAFEYKTRPSFSAAVSCRRENARSGCVPILPVTLSFTAPVPLAMAEAVRLVGPDGTTKTPEPASEDEKKEGFTQSLVFRGPFAESQTYAVQMPADLRDDAGRTLPRGQAKEIAVKTGPLPVLAKFAAGFGILERNAEPALPVTLRSIEPKVAASDLLSVAPPGTPAQAGGSVQGSDLSVSGDDPKQILDWLRRVSLASRRRSVFEGAPPAAAGARSRFTIPKPNPTKETEVVGVPMPKPGLHIVEIESPLLGAALLGQQKPMFVATAALVTNLAVHFKQGREGSIAWVTTLDQAEPVAGARVVASDCNGRELGVGETDANGVARFFAIPPAGLLPSCWPQWSRADDEADHRDRSSVPALAGMASGILVVARTGDDMSFVHSSWDGGIEPWRFQLRSSGWGDSDLVVHTIFDRPLYRAGETVHMKALLRSKSMAGLAVPDEPRRPTKLVVEFTAMQQRHEIPVVFDAGGVATAEWPIPVTAKLGSYAVTFEGTGSRKLWSGTFRVEQFRVPLVRGEVVAPPVVQPRAPSVDVDIGVHYLAGGAASRLPVVLRSELHPGGFDAPDDYAGYAFAAGAVREGLETENGSHDEEEGARPHRRYEAELDHAGGARITVSELPVVDRPTSLVLEAEFRDPNGEVETVATSRTLLPAARVPGIRVDDWTKAEDLVRPHVVVLTPEGRPASGAPVRISVLEREWFSYRKRLVGGFYGYESTSGTRRLGTLCEGTTDGSGLFECAAAAPGKGQLVLEATVTDEGGHEAATHTSVWVPGDDDGFDTSDDDRIDVVPEKKSYEPGETARLQVRMPFREATALVTVEREGVGEARVVRLRAEDPVVEVPISGEHAPNVFVSVLAVRGRVGDVQPTAMLDLGRPAFKLGIAEIRVDWKTHRLDVSVQSDRDTYQVREKARVGIAVTRHDGSAPPEGSEVAVAAVDEGLLELLPNESWKVLDAMMSVRGYEVSTSTAQGQVIGKRHYGRKAVAAGGGGGASAPSRELFDTLLFWSSRVRLDAEGKAEVEVPLNDSLTAFRIVAIATGGPGEFGDGSTTIRSTRELATYSGLPPMVREGDSFTAEFTLRNTGARPLDVMVHGSVEAVPAAGAAAAIVQPAAATASPAATAPIVATPLATPLAEQRVALAPGESRTLAWPASAPKGSTALAWKLVASAEGVSDSLLARQRVEPALPVQVVQATLAQLEGGATTPVAAPAGADTAAAGSGLVVNAAASLGDSVAPMKDWLARYPYTCLEQKVSIAIGREDDTAWQKLMGEIETYVDASGLLAYFPGERLGDDRLTAYVLSIAHAAGRPLPEDLTERLTTALAGFVAGRIVRGSDLDVPDRTLRRLSALEALARHGKADASMLAGITVQPELWPTSAVLDWWSILARMPDLNDGPARMRDVESVMRARLDLSGTTLVFTTEAGDSIWWMMAGADSNAVRLLLHLVEFDLWKEDAPRVLAGAVARRKGGAWQTTIANAWGVVAMRRFARAYDSEPVAGRTELALGAASASIDWASGGAAPPAALLPWPASAAELRVKHEGSGRPWITTTAKAAVARSEPVAAGYRLTRTMTALDAKPPGPWRRGDRVLVRIDIDAQRPMWWVVVDDPVPAGASHLGGGLGRGFGPLLAAGGAGDDEESSWVSPAFVERSQASWRAYLRTLARGTSRLEYTIRLNQAGTFHLPPLRVEALYAPEVFGELPPATITVEP